MVVKITQFSGGKKLVFGVEKSKLKPIGYIILRCVPFLYFICWKTEDNHTHLTELSQEWRCESIFESIKY